MKSFKDSSIELQRPFSDALADLKEKVEIIPEMSVQQTENICTLLKAIQDQLSATSARTDPTKTVPNRETRALYSSENMAIHEADEDENAELISSVMRLCELAKQKEGTKCDVKAHIVIDDLDKLLKFVSDKLADQNLAARTPKKRPFGTMDEHTQMDGRDLKRIRGLLNSSDSVAINEASKCMINVMRLVR